MLAMSDIDIQKFLPIFAATGVPVAFLVPTPTGYEKSIMDATGPVRELLKGQRIHDYEKQEQGPENKVIIHSYFVGNRGLAETSASLYRPITKKGDPRIWFANLKRYCKPCNLLALIIIQKQICVINLSDPSISFSLMNKGFVYDILLEAVHKEKQIATELLNKIISIHNQGYLPSITPGDPGVGDTLENALGISRNNAKTPDYKGIELKTTRLTKHGEKRQETRTTIFTKVPDEGLTYRGIVDAYGKWQIPRGETEPRLQLYETLRASRPNAYGLLIEVTSQTDRLNLLFQEENKHNKYVSAWLMEKLQEALLIKHHETFWVKAQSIDYDNKEYFRYDRVLHTKNPNASLLPPLFESDKITIDLAAHYKPDGKWRDHGVLFKMTQDDLPLLFGEPIEYDLTTMTSAVIDDSYEELFDLRKLAEQHNSPEL